MAVIRSPYCTGALTASGNAPLVRRRPTMIASGRAPGRDGVVPLGMERITLDIDAGHLVVADLDPLGVTAAVELASHDQTGLGGRGGDEFHHRQPAGQRCATPGLNSRCCRVARGNLTPRRS